MDEVKTDNSEVIARLTRERDEARRERDELQSRLEKWQRNQTQFATNQQVARLIRERDEARAEVERLRETNEAIKRVTHAWRVDAERYRWLKTFALYRNEHDASIEFYWPRRVYELDVDAAIDAARGD